MNEPGDRNVLGKMRNFNFPNILRRISTRSGGSRVSVREEAGKRGGRGRPWVVPSISMGGEVSPHLLWLSNHGILPLVPVCGTDLTFVSGDELKGLKNPLGLNYRAANGEVVYHGVHDNPIRIDEKKPSQGNAFLLQEDTVIPCDLLIYV